MVYHHGVAFWTIWAQQTYPARHSGNRLPWAVDCHRMQVNNNCRLSLICSRTGRDPRKDYTEIPACPQLWSNPPRRFIRTTRLRIAAYPEPRATVGQQVTAPCPSMHYYLIKKLASCMKRPLCHAVDRAFRLMRLEQRLIRRLDMVRVQT